MSEEKDAWGQDPEITSEDLQVWRDFRSWSKDPQGKRILAYLRVAFHADETMTYEEHLSENGQPTPIDQTAYLLRAGMRRAWRLIQANCDALDRIEANRIRKEG